MAVGWVAGQLVWLMSLQLAVFEQGTLVHVYASSSTSKPMLLSRESRRGKFSGRRERR
jgi:hypothetical protein